MKFVSDKFYTILYFHNQCMGVKYRMYMYVSVNAAYPGRHNEEKVVYFLLLSRKERQPSTEDDTQAIGTHQQPGRYTHQQPGRYTHLPSLLSLSCVTGSLPLSLTSPQTHPERGWILSPPPLPISTWPEVDLSP